MTYLGQTITTRSAAAPRSFVLGCIKNVRESQLVLLVTGFTIFTSERLLNSGSLCC